MRKLSGSDRRTGTRCAGASGNRARRTPTRAATARARRSSEAAGWRGGERGVASAASIFGRAQARRAGGHGRPRERWRQRARDAAQQRGRCHAQRRAGARAAARRCRCRGAGRAAHRRPPAPSTLPPAWATRGASSADAVEQAHRLAPRPARAGGGEAATSASSRHVACWIGRALQSAPRGAHQAGGARGNHHTHHLRNHLSFAKPARSASWPCRASREWRPRPSPRASPTARVDGRAMRAPRTRNTGAQASTNMLKSCTAGSTREQRRRPRERIATTA